MSVGEIELLGKVEFAFMRPCTNRKEGNDQDRYNFQTFLVQDIEGKEGRTKATQSKHYKQKAKMTVSSPKIGKTAISKYKSH